MDKGMASFEFLITLGIILLVTSALITDTIGESRKTMVFSSAKYSLTNQIGAKSFESPGCSNPQIDSYKVTGNNTMNLDVSPDECAVEPTEVADKVEEEICGVTPNGDNLIKCGSEVYEVNIN